MNSTSEAAVSPLDPELCLLSDLLARLPHRPSPGVVARWVTKGRNGTRLSVLKIGGRNHTTPREFERFILAIQPRPAEPTDADHAAVDRQLAEAGYA